MTGDYRTTDLSPHLIDQLLGAHQAGRRNFLLLAYFRLAFHPFF